MRASEHLGAVVVCSIVVLGYIALCALMIFFPPTDNPTVQIMFGGLTAGFANAVYYFTGSTASSKSKDTTIAAIATGDKA